MKISWGNMVGIISVDPAFATKEDIVRLATELLECRKELMRLLRRYVTTKYRSVTPLITDAT